MGAFPLRHLGPRRRLPNQSGGRKINTWRLLGSIICPSQHEILTKQRIGLVWRWNGAA
jgi:hypothetical protein